MNNDSALYCFLDDGVRINFRPYSSSPGSPAVDIHIYSVDKIQKIHFVLRTLYSVSRARKDLKSIFDDDMKISVKREHIVL